MLLQQAEQLSFDDARSCLRRWETLADLDGTLHLRASGGDAVTSAEMIAIFTAELEREFHADVTERTRLHGSDAPSSLLPRTDAPTKRPSQRTDSSPIPTT